VNLIIIIINLNLNSNHNLSQVNLFAHQCNNHRLQRPYFSAVSKAEFSDVLNGKDFKIQTLSQPNSGAIDRIDLDKVRDNNSGDKKEHKLVSSTFPRKLDSKVPLISENDFVSLSLQALQGISSFIYTTEMIRKQDEKQDEQTDEQIDEQNQQYSFLLLGRSATSLSKYQRKFGEFYFIRILLGKAQEAFCKLSSDRGQLALGSALGKG
jgi:hypothetical protein